jgi:Fe-S cluster assembly iron-binding protein IscA
MFEVTEKAGTMIKSVMEKQNGQQNAIRVLLQDG